MGRKKIGIRQSTSLKSFAFLGNVLYFVGISLHPAQSIGTVKVNRDPLLNM